MFICFDGAKIQIIAEIAKFLGHSCAELHTGLLLLAGTGATILRAGLVELPVEVDEERAAGRVVYCQLAETEDSGIGLVGVEDIDAAHIERQLSQAAEVEIALDAEFCIKAV